MAHAPARPPDALIRDAKLDHDNGGHPVVVGDLLLHVNNSENGYTGVTQAGNAMFKARFGNGGTTKIGTFDHPIDAAVAYAQHPEVVAAVKEGRIRAPGAASRRKPVAKIAEAPPLCDLYAHKGSNSGRLLLLSW